MELLFNVREQHIMRVDHKYVVADSRNYLFARFEFSNDWQDVVKTAVFKNNGIVLNAVIEDNIVKVPWEVIKRGYLEVSVFGGDLLVTDKATVNIHQSGYEEGQETQEPSPSVYQQIVSMLENIQSAGISEEAVANLVAEYLQDHPIEPISSREVEQIVTNYVNLNKSELKGDKGDRGTDGINGTNGRDGVDGKNGKDFTYDMFTPAQLATLKGEKGDDGAKGADGKDGTNGKDGANGYTPIKGTDYFTDADKAEIVDTNIFKDKLPYTTEKYANTTVRFNWGGANVNFGGDGRVSQELENKTITVSNTYPFVAGAVYNWTVFFKNEEE